MAWSRLITQALVRRSEFRHAVFKPSHRVAQSGVVRATLTTKVQGRLNSSYGCNLVRRVRDVDEASEVTHLKELHHGNDPEAVIRLFESQPSLHSNPFALAEYVKALVKVDRLNGNELLRTLERGIYNLA